MAALSVFIRGYEETGEPRDLVESPAFALALKLFDCMATIQGQLDAFAPLAAQENV
jgi:hypothetical protein